MHVKSNQDPQGLILMFQFIVILCQFSQAIKMVKVCPIQKRQFIFHFLSLSNRKFPLTSLLTSQQQKSVK
jgi:hypothetical protein